MSILPNSGSGHFGGIIMKKLFLFGLLLVSSHAFGMWKAFTEYFYGKPQEERTVLGRDSTQLQERERIARATQEFRSLNEAIERLNSTAEALERSQQENIRLNDQLERLRAQVSQERRDRGFGLDQSAQDEKIEPEEMNEQQEQKDADEEKRDDKAEDQERKEKLNKKIKNLEKQLNELNPDDPEYEEKKISLRAKLKARRGELESLERTLKISAGIRGEDISPSDLKSLFKDTSDSDSQTGKSSISAGDTESLETVSFDQAEKDESNVDQRIQALTVQLEDKEAALEKARQKIIALGGSISDDKEPSAQKDEKSKKTVLSPKITPEMLKKAIEQRRLKRTLQQAPKRSVAPAA